MSTRLETSRCTSESTSLPGNGRSSLVRANGRAASTSRRSPREHLVEPPARDLRGRQQPQGLARRRTVHDDHVERPPAWCFFSCRSENIRLCRAARSLLGQDLVHATVGKQRRHPALHRLPVALQLPPRPAPPGPQRLSATATGCGPKLGLEFFDRPCAGSVESTTVRTRLRRLRGRSRRRRLFFRPPLCPYRGCSCGVSPARFYAAQRYLDRLEGSARTSPCRRVRVPGEDRARAA